MELEKYTVTEENARVIKNQKDELVGVIYHHMGKRLHLLYLCNAADGEQIASMIENKNSVV